MTADQRHRLRKTFAALEGREEVAALIFYRRLFQLAPSLRALFRTDIESQARKLMEMLAYAMSQLENRERLRVELERLGFRHVNYGVQQMHYATVGQALLDMLKEVLGEAFTPAAERDWTLFYHWISAAMQQGASRAHSSEFALQPRAEG